MARRRLHPLALAVTLLAPLLVALPSVRGEEAGAALDGGLFRELRWRPIGPFRGGRTKAATGVPGKPNVFYIGVVNGGVWKTTDYGRTWQPIFDDQPTGSIGAIAVAPSNPDVIYVGSGEGLQRPDLSTGDGIYQSTDGGQDLDAPRPARRPADPADRRRPEGPEAALRRRARPPVRAERGARRLPLDRRRARRSRRSSTRTRTPAPSTSPSTRATRPRVYAVALGVAAGAVGERRVHAARAAASTSRPTAARPGGRSTNGLPTFADGLGRIGITVAPSDPRRLYATVEARDKAGLYRSDDAGETWSRVNADPRVVARPDDFAEVHVHPTNPDVVFVPTIVAWKSTDGGKHVHGLPRRAGRRRLPPHLDQPRPPRRDDPARRTRARSSRSTAARRGAAGTTSRPRSSTT